MNSPLPPVDVIVPVYRNLDVTRRCIESVLRAPKGPRARLIVINDASPEAAVGEYCRELQSQGRPDVLVLENADNLGFVATVNRGMTLSDDNDVVLLNSDTQVAKDWLARLQYNVHSEAHYGTATPLSNNASMLSYPLPMQDNPLPSGWSLEDLASLAAMANPSGVLELPTAVGFCMYIRRDCLKAVGLFDVENFGLGYGEECDFSMRVRKAGWRNILSPDVFVFHEGGQSFQGTTKERIAQAEQTLHRLHPEYHPDATRFIDEDPVRPFRDALDRARLKQRSQDAPAIIEHLRKLRDLRIEQRSNREQALSHAAGELREQLVGMEHRVQEHEKMEKMLSAQLKHARDSFAKTDKALAETTSLLKERLAELQALRDRDQRWRALTKLVEGLDRMTGKAE